MTTGYVQNFLLDHLPTFCWQDFHEILTVFEQAHEDVHPDVLATTIAYLHRRGWIESRWDPHHRVHGGGRRGFTYTYKLSDRLVEIMGADRGDGGQILSPGRLGAADEVVVGAACGVG